MKYHLWIIGCQYNEWDGARLRYFLDSLGLQESDVKEADIIVIVACAVRQTAVDRIFGKIRNITPTDFFRRRGTEFKNQLTNQPITNKLVLITGCVLDSDKEKFAKKGIKFFEPGDLRALEKIISVSRFPTKLGMTRKKTTNHKLQTKNYNYVPIMTGCNNFCSYCAVPYTRGREKSRPMEKIINDVEELINNGHKEIMLLGQNVNSYKITNNEKLIANNHSRKTSKLKDFTKLLEKLDELPGDFEISFISNHPKDMSDDIINAVAILPKVKKEIHLPLQSGSNKVLRSMNRPYTIEQYLKIIDKIKKASSNVRVTTDVIVGYPTETKKDFEETVKIFKKVNFKQAYINKYSPRVGTAAYKLGDLIPWSEKQRRWRILNDIITNK